MKGRWGRERKEGGQKSNFKIFFSLILAVCGKRKNLCPTKMMTHFEVIGGCIVKEDVQT